MGDDYQSRYYQQNRERILARKRDEYARVAREKNARARERRRQARAGRSCAVCGAGIDHLIAKAAYCGKACKSAAARARSDKPARSRSTCRLCDRKVASEGLCSGHNHRRRRYGLSDEEMTALDAGVTCAICPEIATHVDHSHDLGPGTRRGFLCRSCNLGLGNFRDRIDLLERAAEYLRAAQ